MKTLLSNCTIFTGTEMVTGSSLLIDEGVISGIVSQPSSVQADEVTDCKGYMITPGLIDLQIAGGGGILFSSGPGAEALETIAEAIINSGTTSFLIALPTNTAEVYNSSFPVLKMSSNPAVLGLHMEGPYISLSKRGAHPRELIRKADPETVIPLIEESCDTIKMMTVAPEVCSREVLDILTGKGIVVAAGHSNATFHQARQGFDNGIETTTHLFNAMSPLHHRDPGLPGAVFNSTSAKASIIADGIHLDYSIIDISKKVLGERLFLVSDAVEESDTGVYRHVKQYDRFTLPDGTLSGSKLTLLKAVRNCVENTGIGKEEALRMASLYPAMLMHLSDRGRIAPGYRADLIAIDSHLDLKAVWHGGTRKFLI